MTGWDTGTASLPSSHVFLTAAFGRRQKTVAVPRWAATLVLVGLGLALLWSLGCTVYVVGHDSLLAAAMRRERDLQYDYEDRIAALQRQLDRTTSQQAQLERTVGTRLDMLTAQEGELRHKAGTVDGLAEAVERVAPRAAATAEAPARPAAAMKAPDHDALRDVPSTEKTGDRLAALSSAFEAIEFGQQGKLAHLQTTLTGQVARYRDALGQAGLAVARFAPDHSPATGGPFVPLDAAAVRSPFERASLTLSATLAEAERLKTAVARAPFGRPLEGTPEVTSPFGARVDPFLGRPALHTGVDLAEASGTEVLATAPGRVVSAGPVSGYGNMVEIDHGAGLTTRYAHLSALAVDVGQNVAAGAIVGRVGTTGRATGPHLHYETRIDGEPVDPLRFLQAGERLAAASQP